MSLRPDDKESTPQPSDIFKGDIRMTGRQLADYATRVIDYPYLTAERDTRTGFRIPTTPEEIKPAILSNILKARPDLPTRR